MQWLPTFKWITSCKVDLFYFPYDEQFCEVQFVNWMYGAFMVNFTSIYNTVETTYYSPNGEWDLIDTKVGQRDMVHYESFMNITFVYPMVGFRLHLGRRPGYHFIHIILPTVIMTLMSLLVFCLPPEAGEKLSLGITVLLSYTVVILMVSDITPRVSDSLPLISKFYSDIQ